MKNTFHPVFCINENTGLKRYIIHISLTNESLQAFQVLWCRKSFKLSFNTTFCKV